MGAISLFRESAKWRDVAKGFGPGGLDSPLGFGCDSAQVGSISQVIRPYGLDFTGWRDSAQWARFRMGFDPVGAISLGFGWAVVIVNLKSLMAWIS